jgi:hypothetical protein
VLQIHGQIFKASFGVEVPDGIVGEGFSISKEGALSFRSSVFNCPIDCAYHDGSRDASDATKLLLHHVVNEWKAGRLAPGTTVQAREILAQYCNA